LTHLTKLGLVWLTILVLAACGGGGETQSAPNVPPTVIPPTVIPPTDQGPVTPSQTIADAKRFSSDELLTAATSLASETYSGSKQPVELDLDTSQQIINYLFNTDAKNLPTFLSFPFGRWRDSSGTINGTFACDFAGSVTIDGQLNDQSQGSMTLSLEDCSSYSPDETVNGTVALTLNIREDNLVHTVTYFDNVNYVRKGIEANASGYVDYRNEYDPITTDFTITRDTYATLSLGGQTALIESSYSSAEIANQRALDFTGKVSFFEEGTVEYFSENIINLPPYFFNGSLTLLGNKTTTFAFDGRHIKYGEDANNDGSPETGIFIVGIEGLLSGDLKDMALANFGDLSRPPLVGPPDYFQIEDIYTSSTIRLREGFIEDLDNSYDELEIAYRWYLNDELLTAQTNTELPPNIAVFGDGLRATMVVSDGPNTVEGPSLEILLSDSPQQVSFVNKPDTIRAGHLLAFTALMSDPDLPNSDINPAGQLVSGPQGATMSANGEVNWQIPNDLLFPVQTYSFTFSTSGDASDSSKLVSVDIDVTSTQAMPLARKGIEVPQRNSSMAIGDFDGDGFNEILSTDNISSVFLSKNTESGYEQVWTYPFKIDAGDVLQVLAVNVDNDAESEIVIVSSNAISIIYDLHSMAETVLYSPSEIKYAQLADTNEDGVLELAYLTSGSRFDNRENELKVVSIDTPQNVLFAQALGSAKEFVFGNVDNDINIELITNNGFVYDAFTWQNQWTSGNEFSDSIMVVADLNNDGVDEIVGADYWGDISVYSVLSESKIASIESYNNCSVIAANVDSGAASELIVGECGRNEITAFSLLDNTFESVWSISSQASGLVSLVTGDSDNDGDLELHWGAGMSSSEANILAGANLDTSLGTAAPIALAEKNVQLSSYSSAGWSTITDNNEKAVFFTPQSAGGAKGSRVILMAEDGTLSLSSELTKNLLSNASAVTNDFNKDGFGDLFLPYTEFYSGALAAMQLSNESIHFQTIPDANSSIGLIKVFDVNQDDFDDAVYLDRNSLRVLDVINQTDLLNLPVSARPHDFAVFKIGDSTAIALALGQKTALYVYNGATFVEQHSIEQECYQLAIINSDEDIDIELACVSPSTSNDEKPSLIMYDIRNNLLEETHRNTLGVNVKAIIVDPSTSVNQNLFIVAESISDSSISSQRRNGFIAKANTRGEFIWRSPLLIGSAIHDGFKARLTASGKVELLYATNQMMYWIK
jgi:hypothetical protein